MQSIANEAPSRIWRGICALIVLVSLAVCLQRFGLTGTATEPSKQLRRRRQLSSPFHYWTSEEIFNSLRHWRRVYPDLVSLTTAQAEFGIPAAGNASDCPFEKDLVGCSNWILTLEDKLQRSGRSSVPEVFLSGALHGDDVIGPTVVMETVKLLLEAAACESMPQGHAPDGTQLSPEQIEEELVHAKQCRADLSAQGVYPIQRKWLARLVTTRRIIVLPTANSLGYFRGTHSEENADPSSDFPFDLDAGTPCFQTIAAQSFARLFANHVIQLGISFRTGSEAVAYQWGSPSQGKEVPDGVSHRDIAWLYQRYAGSLDDGNLYSVGAIKDTVQPARGGLEDWSYAASWNDESVTSGCAPNSFGWQKNDAGFRMFNTYVGTSKEKPKPENISLGADLFTPLGNNGHIDRNIRVSMAMIDMVEPYVTILSINGVELWDDIVPLSPRYDTSCFQTKVMSVPLGTQSLVIRWTTGGGFSVDETSLWYGSHTNMTTLGLNCSTNQVPQHVVDEAKNQDLIYRSEQFIGKTRWHEDIPFPPPNEEAFHPAETIFETKIDIGSFEDQFLVYAIARLDQAWNQLSGAQSHVVRARTDPSWRYPSQDGSNFVEGRLDWLSIPVTIEFNRDGVVQERSVRNPLDALSGDSDGAITLAQIYGAIAAGALIALIICACALWREADNGTEVWSAWANKYGLIVSTTADHDVPPSMGENRTT